MKPLLSHPWEVTREEAYRIQEDLAKRLVMENGFKHVGSVAGADVSFNKKKAYAALVIYSYPGLEKLEEVLVAQNLSFPYLPGLLSFREGPVLLQAFEEARTKPDLVLFDGQGVAHPRGLGLASHMGVLLGIPSIGCAKSRLVGEYGRLDSRKGSVTPLILNGESVGAVLRTRDGVRPLFVSPGHLIDLQTSVSVVLSCLDRYRIPKPLREADQASRKAKLCKSLERGGGWNG